MANYFIPSEHLSFADYVKQCRIGIEKGRRDLHHYPNPSYIIDANTPYELIPDSKEHHYQHGVLLIHGLLDCPFSLKEIGDRLQKNGVFCRSLLLPGHGTHPSDLLHVNYQDWIKTVEYGIACLKEKVDRIFLLGYSTGATLSILEALQNHHLIAGIILIAPAIKIKTPIDVLVGWRRLIKWMSQNKEWLYRADENDYTKYHSITFHAVMQVYKLTEMINRSHEKNSLACPLFIVMSKEDETVSAQAALDFFSLTDHPHNQFLLYVKHKLHLPDERIIQRITHYQDLNIEHFSHVSLPFSPDNTHYGKQGDYPYATHVTHDNEFVYGAYNHIETQAHEFLYHFGLSKKRCRELTYNPDFDFMIKKIVGFIESIQQKS